MKLKPKLSSRTLWRDSGRGGGELLKKLQALAEAESELSIRQNRLSDIEAKIAKLTHVQKKIVHLKCQQELKSYDPSLFQSRAEQNEHHKLGEVVRKLEQQLEEMKLGPKEKQLLFETCVATVSTLEKSIKEHSKHRDARLKDLDKQIKTIKSNMQSASKELKGHENERERLMMKKDAVIQELATLESQLASSETQISILTGALDKQKSKVESIKQEYDQAESELNLGRSKMKECDSHISAISKELQKLQQKLGDATVEGKKMENEVKCMEMEQKDCSLRVDKLLQKHGWIASERLLFGKKWNRL